MILLLLAMLSAPQQGANAFVRKIIAAMNSGSVEKRRALHHPKDASCDARGDSMIVWQLNRQAKRPIPANATIDIHKPGDGSLSAPGLMVYSVKPTHEAEIKWNRAENSSVSVFVWLTHDETGWHEVYGCPNPKLLKN